MRSCERERRYTNGDILRAFLQRRTITHPFTSLDDNGLSSGNVDHAGPMLDAQQAREHDCIFIKLRRLPRLDPATWTAHMRNAYSGVARIQSAHILIDQLGLVARRLDSGRIGDEYWHSLSNRDIRVQARHAMLMRRSGAVNGPESQTRPESFGSWIRIVVLPQSSIHERSLSTTDL